LSDPGSKLGNYTVTTNNGTLTIGAAALTASANSTNRVYGASNPALTGGVAGIQNGDNIVANFVTSAGPTSPVGNYAITPTLSDPGSKLGNYTVTTNNGTLTISAAPLKVTANSTNRVFGVQNPIFTGSIVGLQNADSITAVFVCSATTNSPVGTYTISVSLVDPNGRLPNYVVTLVNGTLSVTNPIQVPVTMNAPNLLGQVFTVSIVSTSSTSYALQASDSLSSPNWTTVQTVVGNGAAIILTDSGANLPFRFYRILVGP
jgi:hypothetical protein